MQLQDTMVAVGKMLDGMTEEQQGLFSDMVGRGAGNAVAGTANTVDDFLLLDVAIPNMRRMLDAAEARLRENPMSSPVAQ